jgi:hypothetical protein
MAREHHGEELAKLLAQVPDDDCRILLCLGAAAACVK